jgi:hypothetical protein
MTLRAAQLRTFVAFALLAALVAGGCSSIVGAPEPSAAPPALALRYLGQQLLPHRFQYAGTTVGGLSGIDYDAASGRYWAISDDRSESGPARFYALSLDLARFNRQAEPGHDGVAFHSIHVLKRQDGTPFANVAVDPAKAADPESIRVHGPSGRLVWSSEGDRAVAPGRPPLLVDPHVWEIDRDGSFIRALPLPDKFRASPNERGIRRNLAFEGLAFSDDGATLYVATENALLQDGPIASLTASSPSRIIAYDFATGAVRAEYIVDVAPIPVAPRVSGGFADNGISEILWLGEKRLLLLERSFAQGFGTTIKLFEVDLRGATDVSQMDSVAGRGYVPAAKRLVLDLATLGIRLDNFEGMTFGPRLADGRRSLVLLSDDNFNPSQLTLFLAFAVDER